MFEVLSPAMVIVKYKFTRLIMSEPMTVNADGFKLDPLLDALCF